MEIEMGMEINGAPCLMTGFAHNLKPLLLMVTG